jgi:hypothetical protein
MRPPFTRFADWAVASALVLAIPACATMSTPASTPLPASQLPTKFGTYVARGTAAWLVAKTIALAWLPRLSPERQQQVEHAIAIGDEAVRDAQLAATLAEQVAALDRANGQMAAITAAVSQD